MVLLQFLLLIALCSSEELPARAELSPPSILLGWNPLLSGSKVVLDVGSAFSLRCLGNLSSVAVVWSSTAFQLRYHDDLGAIISVHHSEPRHTGTYCCRYQDKGLDHLDTWTHIYVKDSSTLFVTPRSRPKVEEGQNFLFECLLTDPSASGLALRLAVAGGGHALPQGMNVTIDPQRGALIRNVSSAHRGRYICTAWRDGKEYKSAPLSLLEEPRVRSPPSLSISRSWFLRLEGESLQISCFSTNPSHQFTLLWSHPLIQELNVSSHLNTDSREPSINSSVWLPSVRLKHCGLFTCTATNPAGSSVATAKLTVLDAPYLRIYLQLTNASISDVEVNGKLLANVSANRTDVHRAKISSGAAEVNGGVASIVDVWEGTDAKLSFMTETYPPLHLQQWRTPAQSLTTRQESCTAPDRCISSLVLSRVRFEDRGRYTFFFSSLFFNGTQTINLRVYRSPSVGLKLTANRTLACSATGYPLPTILWFICPGITDTCGGNSSYQVPPAGRTSLRQEEQRDEREEREEQEEEQREELVLPSIGDDVTVECLAQSLVGESRDVFVSYVSRASARPDASLLSPTLMGASGTAVVLFFLLVIVLYKYKQKPRYEVRWKIIDNNHSNNYSYIDPSQLPYNHKWEFPRDRLRLGCVLGAGAFGKVVEATALGLGAEPGMTRVAVKMLKPSAHSEEREALMSELKILSHLGYHDNIVNLLGACTHGGPMLMITEYCSHGDLLNFLRGQARDLTPSTLLMDQSVGYKNMEAETRCYRSDSGISCSDYQEMHPTNTHCVQGGQTDSLSLSDLLLFCYQAARGLDFLSSRSCIHRDVAARNVLLTEHRVAKICDFGLARDLTNDDNYVVKGNALLPVKWMSPESIFHCVYTTQSDVWSYGVLLWEIFSLGKSPYPNVTVDTNFYKMIKDGRHMSQPDFAPTEMYQLMMGCWNLDPTQRPTFTAIGQMIQRLCLPTNEVIPHHHDQPTYFSSQQTPGDRNQVGRGEEQVKSTEEEQQEMLQEEAEPLMMRRMIKNVYQVC